MCQDTDDEFRTTDDVKQILSDFNYCTKFQILQFYVEKPCIITITLLVSIITVKYATGCICASCVPKLPSLRILMCQNLQLQVTILFYEIFIVL